MTIITKNDEEHYPEAVDALSSVLRLPGKTSPAHQSRTHHELYQHFVEIEKLLWDPERVPNNAALIGWSFVPIATVIGCDRGDPSRWPDEAVLRTSLRFVELIHEYVASIEQAQGISLWESRWKALSVARQAIDGARGDVKTARAVLTKGPSSQELAHTMSTGKFSHAERLAFHHARDAPSDARHHDVVEMDRWVGKITGFDDERGFIALMSDIEGTAADKFVHFSVDQLIPADRGDLREGSVVAWENTFVDDASGRRSTTSILHLRKAPIATDEMLADIAKLGGQTFGD